MTAVQNKQMAVITKPPAQRYRPIMEISVQRLEQNWDFFFFFLFFAPSVLTGVILFMFRDIEY